MNDKKTAIPRPRPETFEEVKRYRCRYCGREFRSNKLHRCLYNPEIFHNCMSCENLYYVDEYGMQGEATFQCKIHGPVLISKVRELHWSLHCNEYHTMTEYHGKESYIKRAWRNELKSSLIKHIEQSETPIVSVWLKEADVIRDSVAGITIATKSEYHRQILDRYYGFIQEALSRILEKDITLQIIIRSDTSKG